MPWVHQIMYTMVEEHSDMIPMFTQSHCFWKRVAADMGARPLCTAPCAQPFVHSLLCTAPCAQPFVHSLLCTAPRAQPFVHSRLCTAPCAQPFVPSLLCSSPCAQPLVHSPLCTASCAQPPVHSPLCTALAPEESGPCQQRVQTRREFHIIFRASSIWQSTTELCIINLTC